MTDRRANPMSWGSMIHMIYRESALALAVLALWFLALLAPLHQTSGLLRAMAEAGVDIASESGGDAFLCQSVGSTERGSDHALPVCPAQGIGKSDLLLPTPTLAAVAVLGTESDVAFAAVPPAAPFQDRLLPVQPRAPPQLI